MANLGHVIFFALIGGVFSLIGGFVLISNKKRAKNLATYATPFAAGALLSAAFVDLLPEASENGSVKTSLAYALVGLLLFFLLERFLKWFHHHHEHDKSPDPTISLIIIGDTLHNFIDGIAIAAGFLIDVSAGMVVTMAVAAHEIPQEIGDFGLLLKKGMNKNKVILVNLFSALATVIAAVIFFQLGKETAIPLDIVLGLVAGFFIYIAASDIIPSIHESEEKVLAGSQSALLIAGVIVVSFLSSALHGIIETETDIHDHGSHSETEHSQQAEHQHSTYEFVNHDELPYIDIELEKDAKTGYNLIIYTSNFTFTPANVNETNVAGEGHAHLYVNGEKITRLYSPYYYLGDLENGDQVSVILSTNDHQDYTHDGLMISDMEIVE